MENNFLKEQEYIRAKKKVKEMKAFYIHLIVYVLVNIFLSGIIIFGLTQSGETLAEATSNFGVYSTWIFWGIGLFFHWLNVFGFGSIISKDWEAKKIKEIMEKDKQTNN
ncbi:2TM domain-containing protein [uncultured Polaribacter sp.]|uniref:2TM domain-containing protein n=1 Tax=uncultured Polaribacter sp. TaxID=174711 RepID=UPI00263571F8|nr:2TM domain-containing protein [uncultured Polaribacter sp.]